jgi:hypothetical protein
MLDASNLAMGWLMGDFGAPAAVFTLFLVLGGMAGYFLRISIF